MSHLSDQLESCLSAMNDLYYEAVCLVRTEAGVAGFFVPVRVSLWVEGQPSLRVL